MIDARTEELINADIDGELDADARQELRQRLSDSAEARTLHAQLVKLDSLLKALPQQEAPATLRESITTAVELPQPDAVAVAPFVASWPGVARYGLAAALGGLAVALGFFSTMGMWESPSEYDQLIGTIAPASSGAARLVDQQQLNLGDADTKLRLLRRGRQYIVEIEADGDTASEMQLSISERLQFEAMAQQDGQPGSFSVTDQQIVIRDSGTGRFAVMFRDTDPDAGEGPLVNVHFFRQGTVIGQLMLGHE